MKLAKLVLKPDHRIKEIAYTLMTSDRFELSFEAGVVSIKEREKDLPPFLVPFSNVHYMQAEPPPMKAASKAA